LFLFVRIPSKTRTSALKLFFLILNVFQQEQCNTVNHFIPDSMINEDEMIHCVTTPCWKTLNYRDHWGRKRRIFIVFASLAIRIYYKTRIISR